MVRKTVLKSNPGAMHSQFGEDTAIFTALEAMKIRMGYFVDVGAADGIWMNNVRFLVERGWFGLHIEADSLHFGKLQKNVSPFKGVNAVFVRVTCEPGESLDAVLDGWETPNAFEVLSLDIDGNDYWVWKSLRRIPKIVVVEYNSNFQWRDRKVMPYDPTHVWKLDKYYGASAGALFDLAKEKGYELVHHSIGNLIFVLRAFAGLFEKVELSSVPFNPCHSPSPRLMAEPKKGS